MNSKTPPDWNDFGKNIPAKTAIKNEHDGDVNRAKNPSGTVRKIF